ncbi:MFS transporter [Nicoliella spurrieriana]|uniref:MFS transporter n=1 Tax=Nicoliella spurrieriana TaxID=2925830 RepID=A0A976RTD2_9LACO|nr:MFS transporter [Nicoliella spurrieriana]UQS87291.1 MFS transporter [Nicoliella spurrieriana]
MNSSPATLPTISNHDSKIQIIKDAISNFISAFTGNMFSMALGLMLLDQTKLPISFGMTSIIAPIVSIAFMVPIGNWVDTYRHKHLLVISSTLRIIIIAIFYATMGLFSGMALFIPVALLLTGTSISANLSLTAYSASVHELVNDDFIQKLSSISQSASALSTILAPLFAVGIYSFLGFDFFIIMELIANLVALLILLSMKFHYVKVVEERPTTSEGTQFAKFKAVLSYINQEKIFKYTIVAGLVVNFVYSSLTVGYPYIIKTELHLGNGPLGILNAASSIGILIGSLFTIMLSKVRYRYKFMVPFILMNVFIALIGLTFIIHPSQVTVSIIGGTLSVLFGIATSLINITLQVLIQKTVANDMLGRVMSLDQSLSMSIMPLGVLTYSILFGFIRPGGLILIINGVLMSIYILLLTPFFLRYFKDHHM